MSNRMKITGGVVIPLAIAILTAAGAACTSAPASGAGDTPISSVDPTPTPLSTQPLDLTMVEVPAPIDSVEINVAESFPPQYFAHVVSGLPNGCVKFDRYEVERDGNTVTIAVSNLEPAGKGIICTMIYGMVESNVALGSDFVPGQTYTVTVNDVDKTFVAQGAVDSPVPGLKDAKLGRSFQLEVGQAAVIGSEGLEITFVEVVEDSRCAADVVCVWAGQASILVAVAGKSEEERLKLTREAEQAKPAVSEVGGYVIELVALNPYPGTEADKAGEPVTATLLVSSATKPITIEGPKRRCCSPGFEPPPSRASRSRF